DGSPPALDSLGLLRDDLQNSLFVLQQPFTTKNIQELAARPIGPNAVQDFLEVQQRLRCPGLIAADREALWRHGRELERRLHDETIALDREEDQGKRVPSPIPDSESRGSLSDPVGPGRRARLSIDLLKLAGMETDKLEEELVRTRATGPD